VPQLQTRWLREGAGKGNSLREEREGVRAMDDKLTKVEAAEILGISVKTLNNWLAAKKGPPHYKYIGRIWFDPKELENFKRQNTERRMS
jgi:hypothetical protein